MIVPQKTQFRLTTVFLLTLIAALTLGWWTDRGQLNSRLNEAMAENRIRRAHIANLRSQISEGRTFLDRHSYTWSNVESFIEFVTRTGRHDTEFVRSLDPIGDSYVNVVASFSLESDDRFEETIERLIELLDSEQIAVRLRALVALRLAQETSPDRMYGNARKIVSSITPLIDDESNRVAEEAIRTLALFGTLARSALPALEDKMSDNADTLAPQAAVAIKSIEPKAKIRVRLKELVRSGNPSRLFAQDYLAGTKNEK